MINIMCYCPDPTDATSWYRGLGALNQLCKIDDKINVTLTNLIHWTVLKGQDILFFQRPTLPEQINALKIAKELNIKIWVDYCDIVTKTISGNPYLKEMKKIHCIDQAGIKENVIQALLLSDVVTVSTNALKEELEKIYKANIVVVNNAHDDYMYPLNLKNKGECSDVVLWRGSSSHIPDIDEYIDAIDSIVTTNGDIEFVFAGYNPKNITNKKNCTYIASMNNPTSYFGKLKLINPLVTIVPLKWHEFNICKSNIAALESLYFTNGNTLAPDWDEWRDVANTYTNKQSFVDKLNEMIKTKKQDNQKEIYYKNFKEKYLLSNLNNKRLEIIKKLVGC